MEYMECHKNAQHVFLVGQAMANRIIEDTFFFFLIYEKLFQVLKKQFH